MKVLVWNENIHEKEIPRVTDLYPGGLHKYIASFLKSDDLEVSTATLDDEECGLTDGWFNGGEVFRSGCTWVRGNGKIFYFQPGHETNESFHNHNVQRIIKNAVKWACPIKKNIELVCPCTERFE